MPEHLRALIVILALATAVFAFARMPASTVATAPADFNRRWYLWFGVTLVAFLAHNFWVYVVAAAVMLLLAAQREPNKLALYFFLLFAVPAIPAQITGLGVIQHFFSIDYIRLLALAVLFPAFLSLRNRPDTMPFGRTLPDKLLVGYLLLQLLLMLSVSTFTNTLRSGVFYAFIDVFLPYYVASRALRNLQGFRDALMAFVVAALVLGVIGTFEFTRHWLLYSRLDSVLGQPWELGSYLARGSEGSNLRAQGTTGQPIPFGYVMAVALGFLLYLKKYSLKLNSYVVAMVLLGAGLYASLSRGPWIGAAAMIVVFVATGASPVKGLAKLGMLGALALPVLLVTDSGRRFIELLPFIGATGAENISYRQRLAEISLQVIMDKPFFGAFDYYYLPQMQELRQGQGIIDIVNTYLAVGLGSGLVGLSLFAGFFTAVAFGIFRGMRKLADRQDELYSLGQGLLATLFGILVIIATVSSISIIPAVYWTVAGLGVAYARMLVPAMTPVATQPANARTGAMSGRRLSGIGPTTAGGTS